MQARTLLGLSCYGTGQSWKREHLELRRKRIIKSGITQRSRAKLLLGKNYDCALNEIHLDFAAQSKLRRSHILTGEALDGLTDASDRRV